MAKRRTQTARSRPKRKKKADSSRPGDHPIVVMFVDIMGCSEISNHKSVRDYNKFLKQFHDMFRKVTEDHKSLLSDDDVKYFDPKIRGDEGCLMIYVPGKWNLSIYVDAAVNIALDLKRRWLFREDNRDRIKEGLLPSGLGIGVHCGKAFVNHEQDASGKLSYRPEGYVINLAKRIESASRDGKFTHIYVSEAARNHLFRLTDEAAYTFAEPHAIQPKGISRNIQIFEVKHHFLPTDWQKDPQLKGAEKHKSRAMLPEGTPDQLESVEDAYNANPTNLWLAEEYICLAMRGADRRLQKDKKLDPKETHARALEIGARLASSDHRDAGVLTLYGFVQGECEEYAEEQKLYREAIALNDQCAEAHWYLAYSLSQSLCKDLGKRGGSASKPKTYEKLDESARQEVDEKLPKILKQYRRAITLHERQAWVQLDLAAELWRWRRDEKESDDAFTSLQRAIELNANVRENIPTEPYFSGIEEHPGYGSLMGD